MDESLSSFPRLALPAPNQLHTIVLTVPDPLSSTIIGVFHRIPALPQEVDRASAWLPLFHRFSYPAQSDLPDSDLSVSKHNQDPLSMIGNIHFPMQDSHRLYHLPLCSLSPDTFISSAAILYLYHYLPGTDNSLICKDHSTIFRSSNSISAPSPGVNSYTNTASDRFISSPFRDSINCRP